VVYVVTPSDDGSVRAVTTPTTRDVEALWGPATPQFAYQIADRLVAMIADLPPDHPARVLGEQKLAELDRLGHETTKGDEAGY
jgi:hypothetical protein